MSTIIEKMLTENRRGLGLSPKKAQYLEVRKKETQAKISEKEQVQVQEKPGEYSDPEDKSRCLKNRVFHQLCRVLL